MEQVLPDQAARRAARQRRDEAEAARREEAAARAERETTHRMALRWKIVTGAIVTVVLAAPVVWYVARVIRQAEREVAQARADEAARVARRAQAGEDALAALVAAAQVGRCGRVFIEPEVGDGSIELRFTLGTRRCARLLATTAVPDAVVTLTTVGGDGQPGPAVPPARALDVEYCPRVTTGTHQASLRAPGPLSAAAIECDRELPTDPVGVGATRVAELLEARQAAGCRRLLAPAATHVGEATLTATLNRGTCVQLVAATGMADNELTVSLSTPVGRPIAAPAGQEVVLSYCVDTGGPHAGRITPALDGPFTSAAVICPRAAMPAGTPGR